ncbi:uncharacterized protein BP5553_02291 [Venustampulla echinocandica]|uniref:Uncharacterized protein n=1 Tax=Venustampulla echinocandica TaxID=2656787 RepID=A0A370U3G3_9HELO|nr:uncharacterized protein BP5553_02291 [Venustampulla echinocandica]RDL42312.1 hypothetical protein BP5553_02291 [Venustampulla echinocandica]
MFAKKAPFNPPPPGIYRDNTDPDDAASTSSAVLLDDVDVFPDEELPAYEDTPSENPLISEHYDSGPAVDIDPFARPIALPPNPPFAKHDINNSEFSTCFPLYSTDVYNLDCLIRNQSSYPPGYYVHVNGSHRETKRQNNKETKSTVQDFDFLINISNLLVPAEHVVGNTMGELEFLPMNKRGYRGTIIPSLKPVAGDVESGGERSAWCERYVSDRAGVKSFMLKREIRNHDIQKLESLIRSAIAETKYRGHLQVTFPTSHDKILVYSPGLINQWRTTTWLRWVFYLTFLWVFAWPVLFFITSRYEVIKSVWMYADLPSGGNDVRRKPTVMSEVDWYNRWESTIKRAALARMNGQDVALDEEYRLATVAADQRGVEAGRNPANQIPRTGNAFADGALGLLGQGLRVAERYNDARGWGGDC